MGSRGKTDRSQVHGGTEREAAIMGVRLYMQNSRRGVGGFYWRIVPGAEAQHVGSQPRLM
jgi:hypothetical protein